MIWRPLRACLGSHNGLEDALLTAEDQQCIGQYTGTNHMSYSDAA